MKNQVNEENRSPIPRPLGESSALDRSLKFEHVNVRRAFLATSRPKDPRLHMVAWTTAHDAAVCEIPGTMRHSGPSPAHNKKCCAETGFVLAPLVGP